MDVLAPVLNSLQDLIVKSSIREFCELLFNHWWLENGRGGNIYTMEIGKHYKSGLSFIWNLVYQYNIGYNNLGEHLSELRALKFFFFSAKCVIGCIWTVAWEKPPGWFKRCLVATGRGSGRSPNTRGVREGPLQRKATGLQRFLVVFEDEPFQKTPTQASPGACQPARLVRWSPTFLTISLPHLESGSPESQRDEGRLGIQIQRAWFRFFSKAMAASMVSRVLPHSSWHLLHILHNMRAQPPCWFCIFKRFLVPSRFSSANSEKKLPMPARATSSESK